MYQICSFWSYNQKENQCLVLILLAFVVDFKFFDTSYHITLHIKQDDAKNDENRDGNLLFIYRNVRGTQSLVVIAIL